MKFFARLRRSTKARGNILFRYGWKITLLLLLAGAVFAVFLFYGTWAQTFDMKNVGEMPERNTVYDVDGKIYSRLAGANRLKVSLSEVSPYFIASVLARLIRSPNRFSPLKNPEGAATQRNAVLDRMVALKKITLAQAGEAKKAKIVTHPKRMPQVQENYAMDAVQRALSLILTQDQMDDGGLSIYTTLDPSAQNSAQDALETQLSKIEHQSNFHHPTKTEYKAPEKGEGDSAMPYLEGAVVLIDNASGGIRALVGGRDYGQSKFNRALAPANRQVGSAFKPFVYAIAFSHGLLPGAAISDGQIQPGEIDGAGNWSPANSDGTYGGI